MSSSRLGQEPGLCSLDGVIASALPPAASPTSARWEKGMRILLHVLKDDLHGMFPSQKFHLTFETLHSAIHPYGPASSDHFPWPTST